MTTRSDSGLHCLSVTGRVEWDQNRRKDAESIEGREEQMCSTRGENNDPAGECTPVGVCVKAHSNYTLTAAADRKSPDSNKRLQKHMCSKATCRAVPAICWTERAHSWGVMRPSDLVRQPLLTRHPIIKSKPQDTNVSIWRTPFYIGVLANDEGCSWSCTKRAQLDRILNELRQYTANKPTASKRKQINITDCINSSLPRSHCICRKSSADLRAEATNAISSETFKRSRVH